MRLPKKVNPYLKKILLVLAVSAIASWTWYWWPRSGRSSLKRTVMTPANKELPSSESWKVLNVSDGDTVLAQRGNEKVRFRFCGIDAPEVRHGNQPAQPLGNEARDYIKSLIAKGDGSTIEVTPIERDRYDRVVAELFVIPRSPSQPGEEIFLNSELVQQGFAYHYERYSSNCMNRDAIREAEAIARENRVGVWKLPNGGQRPWDYRRRN